MAPRGSVAPGRYERQIVTVIIAALISVLVLAVARPTESQRTTGFDYTLPVNPAELDDSRLAEALDKAKGAGIESISSSASWWYLNQGRSPRSYDWSALDRLVSGAGARGLSVRLQLSGTPDWVHPDLKSTVPNFYDRIWHPPRGSIELGHWSDFVADVVSRYKGRVVHYEMWNEPITSDVWKPGPKPAEYAALLRSAYLSAKSADPNALVVFGSPSRNDVGYLDSYYSEAEKYPDVAGKSYFFDVLGVHPYTEGQSPDWADDDRFVGAANGPLDPSFTGMEKMKAAMEQNGDPDKSIFIGEFGYSTADTWMKAVPDYRRALYLKRAYAIARDIPYVSGMSWYSYIPGSSDGEEWTILDHNLNPSMTYRALDQATGAEEVEVVVSLLEPRGPVSGTYVLEPALSGADEADASGWELFVDGNLAGSYDKVPFEWDTRQVENGDHSLLLAMYAKDGSVWPSDPVTLKVSNASKARERSS